MEDCTKSQTLRVSPAEPGDFLLLIKAERQLRRLFTYLVFQYPCFSLDEAIPLRDALTSNRNIYFEGFIAGINAIYPMSVQDLIGADFPLLMKSIAEAIAARNKLFHGQLTAQYLTRECLLSYVKDIKRWCELLANAANREFGYDGFARQSYRKGSKQFRIQLHSIDEFRAFLKQTLAR
jgi:hypothetical protein